MSDSEWTQILTDIDSMMGGGVTGSGSATYEAFVDGYNEDMTIVELAEGGHGFLGLSSGISNGDEIRTWINNARDDASSAATSFGNLWRTQLRPDVAQMNVLNTMSEAWSDEVHEPVRNEPQAVRDSGLLRSWYGPGAQKYATAVMAQAGAMDEMNSLIQQSSTGLKSTANLVKNVALLMLHSLQPVHDKLSGWPKHGYGDEHNDDMIFGERTGYAKGAFEGLRDWLEDMIDSGDWKNQTDQIRIAFDDAKVKTTAFKANTWPKAATDGIGDMKNGDGGLGDQTQQPGGQQPAPATQPGTDPDADSAGTTTVDGDGVVTSQGGGTPGGDGQYEGGDYGGLDSDGDGTTQDSGTGYSNTTNDDD